MSSHHVVVIIRSFHHNSELVSNLELVPSGQLQLPPDQLISVSPLPRHPPRAVPTIPLSIHVDSSSGFIKHVIHQELSWQLDLPKSEVEPPLPEKPGSSVGSQGGFPRGHSQSRTGQWVLE